MPLPVPKSNDDLLPAAPIRARYGVSDMTIFRWLANPKLGFPQPLRINGRRYWRLADLQAFEVKQSARKEAA
jgi:predicted DNA-binding transcriptional regulator AlpA